MVGVHFVRVITKEEQERGDKAFGEFLALAAVPLSAAFLVYLAVLYWQLTLVALGVAVVAWLGRVVSRRIDRRLARKGPS